MTESIEYEEQLIEESCEVDENVSSAFDMEIAESEVGQNLNSVGLDVNPSTDTETTTLNHTEAKSSTVHKAKRKQLCRLPLSRVRNIMTLDPDCRLISKEAQFVVTKAAEFFLLYMVRQCEKQTRLKNRKTIKRQEVEAVIDSVPHLCFLDGALEE